MKKFLNYNDIEIICQLINNEMIKISEEIEMLGFTNARISNKTKKLKTLYNKIFNNYKNAYIIKNKERQDEAKNKKI